MKRPPHRRWLIVACLWLFPAALYWNTIFFRYGFRDDYSILRESHEEPGKVALVAAMQARPLYGALLEWSFGHARTIHDLQWLRLASALVLGLDAVVLYAILRRLKWERLLAALFAGLIVVLPGAQLFVGWTVAWPLGIALLLSLLAFHFGDEAFAETAWRRAVGWGAAVLLVTASALIYQPNSLFYFVPLAAALWPRRRWAERSAAEWLLRHVATVAIGLMAAFTVMTVAFAHEWVPTSNRIALESHWLSKLYWFVDEPLPNALALVVINDDDFFPPAHRAAALVMLLLIAGVICEWRTRGARHGLWWALALCGLLLGSFGVNLLVADRWAVYRVLLPLTGVVAMFLTMSLLTLGGRRWTRVSLALLVLGGAWLAHQQAFELIAWPQGLELALLEKEADRIVPAQRPSVFVITPKPNDHVGKRIFHDEFGSLSTDSDWVPKEMLKDVMRERYPAMPEMAKSYTFASGRKLPHEESFDVIIDLHRLREFRREPPGARPPEATVAAVLSR
jgi:hypothetical protein